ncbi:MAG: hypothetical protein ACTSRH_02305 [Promethearchaeota archaeon]
MNCIYCKNNVKHNLENCCYYYKNNLCSREPFEITYKKQKMKILCCVACNDYNIPFKIGGSLEFKAKITFNRENFTIRRLNNESITHWILKITTIYELLKKGYKYKNIMLEKEIGDLRADIYVNYEKKINNSKDIWIECEECPKEKIQKILEFFNGSFIHVVDLDYFSYEKQNVIQQEKKNRNRINWREIHKKLVFPKTTILVIYTTGLPKIVYGIKRDNYDNFTFIKGYWGIYDLHPYKKDKIIYLCEYNFN